MDQVIAALASVGPMMGTLLVGILGGIALVVLNNRRPTLVFGVTHDRIGMTADDQVHGKVEITYNGNIMSNLYLSHLTVTNRSIKDLKDLELKAWTVETCELLSERSGIAGTIDAVRHTDEFVRRIEQHVEFERKAKEEGKQDDPEVRQRIVAEAGFGLKQRWYAVPVLNRGQSLTLSYLMNVAPNSDPLIYLSCQNAGVRLKPVSYRPPVTQLWGVPIQSAALTGVVVALLAYPAIVNFIPWIWGAAFICLLTGIFASVPGALLIRVCWWVRDKIVG